MAIEWERGERWSSTEVGDLSIETRLLPSGEYVFEVLDDEGEEVTYGSAESLEQAEAKAVRWAERHFRSLIEEGEAGLRALGVGR